MADHHGYAYGKFPQGRDAAAIRPFRVLAGLHRSDGNSFTKDCNMTSLTRLMIVLSVAILPGFAMGHDFRVGDLHVEHPFASATPATAMTGAGYLTILNSGTEDDTLIAVEADYPRVMMHNSATVDGIASMIAMDGVTIPAGETVSFAPGGLHVMFMGLDGDPLDVGESVPATLVFEKAGRLDVVFKVKNADSQTAGAMDHDAHTSH